MKETNFRSPRLRELAGQVPECCYCGEANHGQIVGCHFNAIKYGKGTGIKSHDILAALCDKCHALADGRIGPHLEQKDRDLIIYEGIYRFFLWLLREGHLEVK